MKTNSPVLPASALFLMALCSLAAFAAQTSIAQTPANLPQPAKETQPPSTLMQPALDTLQQALAAVRLDKWKTSNAVRGETSANIDSIHRDLDATLPPLLAAADAAPDSAARMLPAFRNTEALYDVLLRITETGRLSAPSRQSAALEQALAGLENARRAFADRLQATALARDHQVHALEATLHTMQHAPAPPPAPCPTPHRATRRRTHRKPAPKKSTQPARPSGTTTSPWPLACH